MLDMTMKHVILCVHKGFIFQTLVGRSRWLDIEGPPMIQSWHTSFLTPPLVEILIEKIFLLSMHQLDINIYFYGQILIIS
jgi:hypothetical protein